ncbi:MAG: T9SS type A sorting domain-containing protein [Ignavibacteriales bacterium]|nr:T9SS type A sorting domain-containing protein [Ignavibacteriales bacterium]
MSGNVIIGSNLIVPAGKTLTILPGAHVKFANNYTNLIVNGSLQCQYNPAAGNITFDPEFVTNYSGQIIFDGSASSASVLQHVTITNGAGIQCINGASPTIQNCILTRSAQGIYISNSQPSIINNTIYDPVQNGIYGTAAGFSPLIQGNTITKVTNPHNYQGIYLGASTPALINNVISGFCNGAYIGGGCVANTGWDYYSGCNNRITDNINGISTGWGATTYAGLDDATGSGNSIFGNISFDVNTYQYSNFSGFYCYWGDDPKFQADGTSYNDISNFLLSDPCGDSYKSIASNYVQPGNTLKKSGKENILTGIKLEKQGKIDEAIAFFKKLIKRDEQAKSAFTQLVTIKNKYSRPELMEYFTSILDKKNKHYGAVKKLLGDMLLQNNQFDDAIAAYNEAASNCTVAHDGIDARFEKLFAYLHKKNNTAAALQVLNELQGMHLTDAEHVIRLQVAENLVAGTQYSMYKNTISTEISVPSACVLSQNYPNPFNPATIITYALPKAGQVTIKVYDVLGKEVACLINGYKSEGSYTVSFDASKLSSGVYVYQLHSNDIFISKKMVLAK